ncbi:MAG: hypothetical protein HDS59_00155 [Barnesiella sp.]|nr:hypothetical protein [Barnesiella sp.]
MKRIIKFRGKSLKDGRWLFGDFRYDGTFIGNNRVDPRTTTQFTGCLDSKGAEIFEGDIVRFLYRNNPQCDCEAYVFYDGGEWKSQLSDKSYNPNCVFPGFKAGLFKLVVVGNVFDNPEFFRQKPFLIDREEQKNIHLKLIK